MSFRILTPAALILALLFLSATPPITAQPALTIDVEDIDDCVLRSQVEIDIFLDNPYDQIAGWNLWVQLDRPDLIRFDTHLDTIIDTTYWYCITWDGANCIDSTIVDPMQEYDWIVTDTIEVVAGGIDTTGTLVSGWDYVEGRSLSGIDTDLNMVGFYNLPGGGNPPWMEPQEGGTLIRLVANVLDVPDSLTDRTVQIMLQHDFQHHFGFARPNGTSIGLTTIEVVDTACFVCQLWEGDVCLSWSEVSMPSPEGCDSIWIETYEVPILDTSQVHIFDGSVTVGSIAMGDFDANGLGTDIADLVYLVSFMFQDGPAMECVAAADCDGSGGDPNIADLICWVTWMFPPPK